MPTKPVVKDIDLKSFPCDTDNSFTIKGEKFTKRVKVRLEETRYKMDHEWLPLEQNCISDASSDSAADGQKISVRAKPRKKDGTKCGGKPLGDLTITVTNEDSTASDPTSFNVTYS